MQCEGFIHISLVQSTKEECVYVDLIASPCASRLLTLRFVSNPALFFMTMLTSIGGFSQAPLETGIFLEYPVEAQAVD